MWYSQCINQYYLATQHWQVLILIHFRGSPQMLLVFVSLYISFEVWFCSFYIVVSRSKANPTSTHRGTGKRDISLHLFFCGNLQTNPSPTQDRCSMWSQTWTDDDNYFDGKLGVLQHCCLLKELCPGGACFLGTHFLLLCSSSFSQLH